MGTRVWSCPNRQYAEGFLDGVELANDSALRVERCIRTHDGTYVFTMEDRDFDGMEVFMPASGSSPPSPVPLEQLRGDSQGREGDGASGATIAEKRMRAALTQEIEGSNSSKGVNLRFGWHWLLHGMRMQYEHMSRDVEAYYLCRCDAAFVVRRGWREDRGWFKDIVPADPGEIREFLEAVRRDVATL